MNNFDYLPMSFYIFYVLLIGLCIGSFLNVVILRGLSGEKMVFERSKCPKCNNQLKWYMNIPLLSYIFLRGKCAFCKEKISIQYPLVEGITALLFLVSFLFFGFTFKTIFIWIILSLFVVLTVEDIKETVILDLHAYILLVVGFIYSLSNVNNIGILESFLSAIFGFLVFEAMAKIGVFLSGTRMFGEGDSLIALALGSIFGFKTLLLIIFLSIFLQSLSSIPILFIRAFKQRKYNLVCSYTSVAIGISAIFLSKVFLLNNYSNLYLSVSFVVVLLLLWSLKNIITELRLKKNQTNINEEDKFCILPFGPALILSATLCIFYLPQIKSLILNVFS